MTWLGTNTSIKKVAGLNQSYINQTPYMCNIFAFVLQRFYVATSRQLKRLQSKTRSPIYNHFNETVSGASVIRAYGVCDNFIDTSSERVDLNQRYQYAIISANRYIGSYFLHLNLIGDCTLFFHAFWFGDCTLFFSHVFDLVIALYFFHTYLVW